MAPAVGVGAEASRRPPSATMRPSFITSVPRRIPTTASAALTTRSAQTAIVLEHEIGSSRRGRCRREDQLNSRQPSATKCPTSSPAAAPDAPPPPARRSARDHIERPLPCWRRGQVSRRPPSPTMRPPFITSARPGCSTIASATIATGSDQAAVVGVVGRIRTTTAIPRRRCAPLHHRARPECSTIASATITTRSDQAAIVGVASRIRTTSACPRRRCAPLHH